MLGLVLQEASKTTADITIVFTVLSGLFSGISIIVLVAGAWKLSSILTKIETKLEFLSDMPPRMSKAETSLSELKSDINSLWNAFRAMQEHNKPPH